MVKVLQVCVGRQNGTRTPDVDMSAGVCNVIFYKAEF